MRWRAIITAALTGVAQVALAQGLAVQDLTQVEVRNGAFAQGTYGHQKYDDRITIRCESCSDWTSMNVLLGTSTDGTEGRFRSGETTVQHMEDLCKRNAPSCTLKRIDIGPAVGWLTEYKSGDAFGSTAILLFNGDRLTLRLVSTNKRRVRLNMRVLLRDIAPQIVGGR